MHVAKHGAKCLQVQLTHARLNTHVFGGHDYRLSPLHATFADKHLDFGTLVAASQTALPPQVNINVDVLFVTVGCLNNVINICLAQTLHLLRYITVLLQLVLTLI